MVMNPMVQIVKDHLINPRNWTNGRTHFSRTPKKPEYLIARSQLTQRGPLGFGPIQFLMDRGNLKDGDV